MKRTFTVLAVLALVVGACASDGGQTVGDSPGSSTTATTVRQLGSTTTLVPRSMEEQIDQLQTVVEEIRQQEFAGNVAVVIRPGEEIVAGYAEAAQRVGTVAPQYEEDFLRMLGVLAPGEAVGDFLAPAAVPGFYDADRGALVIAANTTELTPYGRLVLVEELTAALTDEAFGWSERLAQLEAIGETEAAVGLRALVRGDAAFTGQRYEDEYMNSTDRFAVQLELISRQQDRTIYPGYVEEFDGFEAEAAVSLVRELVSVGGLSRLDEAYASPPASSEQVYHYSRYLNEEVGIPVELPNVTVSGFQVYESGVLGERGLRAILSEGVNEAQRLQAATGWGGDSYRTWWNGEDVVMLVMFAGDTENDAAELGNTLGKWAIEELPVGAGLTDNRGLAFSGPDAYAFVAHRETDVFFVVASDRDAGRELRNRFWPNF